MDKCELHSEGGRGQGASAAWRGPSEVGALRVSKASRALPATKNTHKVGGNSHRGSEESSVPGTRQRSQTSIGLKGVGKQRKASQWCLQNKPSPPWLLFHTHEHHQQWHYGGKEALPPIAGRSRSWAPRRHLHQPCSLMQAWRTPAWWVSTSRLNVYEIHVMYWRIRHPAHGDCARS